VLGDVRGRPRGRWRRAADVDALACCEDAELLLSALEAHGSVPVNHDVCSAADAIAELPVVPTARFLPPLSTRSLTGVRTVDSSNESSPLYFESADADTAEGHLS
jgi:hypothetical protein